MQPNPNMNAMIRGAGNRSRSLPNIGQTPAVQAANLVMGQPPTATPSAPPQGGGIAPSPTSSPPVAPGSASMGAPSPMAAPPVQPQTFTMHPPGSPADQNSYNYEPQPDGSWRVYPPGVGSPGHMMQASMPRAASTADYRRMRSAFQQMNQPQQPQQAQVPQVPQPAPTPLI